MADNETSVTAVSTGNAIGRVTLRRPPENYLDIFVLQDLVDAMEALDRDPSCRVMVLASEGKHFCAGRNFASQRQTGDTSEAIYTLAVRLMRLDTPWIAAVQGAAIGAGLGLAMAADFRLCGPQAYFSANFVKVGLHHGFGLSVTLPHAVGNIAAADMLLTGRKVGAAEAREMELVSRVSDEGDLDANVEVFAATIAENPGPTVRAIRQTLRDGLADRFAAAVRHELAQQAASRTV